MQITTHENKKTIQLLVNTILFYAVILCTSTVKGAIVQDATSQRNQNTTTSTSWSHITGGGSSKILIVSVTINTSSISSVTYDGTAMTLFGSVTYNNSVAAMYYMVAPATGTKTISITTAASANIRAGAVSYFGVNQTVPLQDLYTGSGNGNNPSYTYNSDPGTALLLLGSTANPNVSSTTQILEQGSSVFNNLSSTSTLGSAGIVYSMGAADWLAVGALMNPVVALPLGFGDIQAHKLGQNINLNWSIYDLKDIQLICIQRSTDGRNFVHVCDIELPASSATVDFSYFDKNAPRQRLYYRIALTDKYGKIEYSPVSSIDNSGGISNVTVYPVPSSGVVNIQSGGVIRKATLFNLSGQIMGEYSNGEFTLSRIDISALEKGIYILQLQDEDGNISKEKIQKI